MRISPRGIRRCGDAGESEGDESARRRWLETESDGADSALGRMWLAWVHG